MSQTTFTFNNAYKTMILHQLNAGNIPFLIGEPGIGKSAFLSSLKELDPSIKVFTLQGNEIAEKGDLAYNTIVDVTSNYMHHKLETIPHFNVAESILYAEEHPEARVILFIDEMNRSTKSTMSALMSIATAHTIGSIKLPKNIQVVVAGNDKGHVLPLDSAATNRVVVQHVEPSAKVFLKVVKNLNPAVKDVITQYPDYIFLKDETIDEDDFMTDTKIVQHTSPRSLEELSKFLNQARNEDLLLFEAENMLTPILEGYLGHTAIIRPLKKEILKNAAKPDFKPVPNFDQIMNDLQADPKALQNVAPTSISDYFLTALTYPGADALASDMLYLIPAEDHERIMAIVNELVKTNMVKINLKDLIASNSISPLASNLDIILKQYNI